GPRHTTPCETVPRTTRVPLLVLGAIVVLVVFSGAPGAGAEKRARPAEAQSAGNERRRAIAPAGIKPVGPYSPGILAGDFLYVSGQGGRDADGKLPTTIEGQVRQTLQ